MRKFLFLTLFLTALLGITSVWAQTTRYVPSEYPSIQAAVNASTAGDIVQIAAGTYSQNNYAWTDFVINKSISLIGAGSGQTIIQFTNKQHGLEIVTPASAVTIQGITFTKMDSNTQSAGWAIIAGETGGSFASLVFDDVEVSHASSRNIALLNATWQDIDMINCNIHHSFGWGMTVRGTITSITVTNSHFDYNGDLTNHPEYGIGFDIDMPQSVAALIINGGTFNHNTAKGVNLVKISSANIEGIDASYNGGAPGGGFGISLWEWAGASSNMNINDCNITGNALDGILFGSEGTTTIQNVLVSGGAISGNGRGGIFCYGMNSSTLTGLMVTGVDLSGNSVGIWSNYPAEIVASPNWWGDLDPSDDVSGNVSYDPWYDSSAMDHLMSNAPVEIVDRNLFFNSIQSAIDAAVAGEVITVAAGTYAENLIINKPVSLRGANYNNSFASRDRVAESIITPSSGLPVSITVDGASFNGFEVTAPDYVYAISCNYTSNVTVSYNYVHHVGSSSSSSNVHAIIYHVGSSNYSNLVITDNKLEYIGRSTLTGWSISAIGILQSTSTGVLTGLEIKRNQISNVEVNTGTWPTGKIAYGIIVNVGSSNYLTTSGKVVSADISNNKISNLTGFVVTGIGLEGNTENAVVQGNDISYLTGYKAGDRAAGGYDLNGVKFETNKFAGTVALNNNVIRAETFVNNGTPNLGYAVANYVPSTVGVPSMSGNWLGSDDFDVLVDNPALNGKIFNKTGCITDFVPYSTVPYPLNTNGLGPVANTTQSTNYATIQEAIDDPETEPGDVIVVAAETFNVMTPIVVNKSVTISGTINRDGRTLIQGTDPAVICVLEIRASNVTIENLEITHTNVPAFPTPGGWVELNVSLVRIPAELEPDLTGVTFRNNKIYIAAQSGEMSTWTGIGMTIGSRSIDSMTLTGNQIYNTRNGLVVHSGNILSITNNVIYNTKGGIMNYTNSLDDAANRTMTSNNWGTAHNEWDIVWNTAYFVPDYQVSVLGLSNANNGAYVLDRRAADVAACGVLTGNRSHIWVDDNDPYTTSTAGAANGNMNAPYANLQLGLAAVVPGGTVYLADGTYVETGQIAVNKDVNIIGEDEATTIIKPAQDTAGSGDAQAFMLVGEGFEMNLSNVTIDCGGKLVRNAIRTKGSGTIDNVTFQNIYYSQYNGWGLAYDWSVSGQNWTFDDCTFQNIERVCVLVDGQTNQATISACDFIGLGVGDDVNYGVEIGDGAHADIGPDNSFSNFLGVASTDDSESGGVMMSSNYGPNPTAAVTGNTFTNNSYGIMIGYEEDDTSFMTISNNTFTNNSVQVTAVSNTVVDLNATWANNTYDHKFLYDYTIYGSGSLLYVEAPEELIKDNELQVYSVKSTYVENLRGFSIQIKIPVADFNQPDHEDPGNDFAIGAAYTAHSYQPAFLQPVVYYGIIDGYYTYKVDGAYYSGGPDSGITGENKELFTVSLTSLVDRDNISVPGCLITIPLDEVVLYDANNPPVEIACVATEPMLVLIDASEPTMLHNTAGTYPTMYLLSVIPDGSGLLDRPTLNFTFTDNYNLQNVQYLIQAEGLGAPTLDTQFPADYILQNSLLATTTLDWQLPADVDALNDGTYTVYYLVLDDAGNYTIYNWDFIIDTTAPDPVTWWPEPTAVNQPAPCRTSVNGNNSIDLKWTNGDGTAKVDIWRYCFGDDATYPEYDVPGFTLPAAPNPYHASPDNGWVRVADDVVLQEHTDSGMPRGYYYYTIFAQDASGNLSAAPVAPFHRESISYWPGDVDANPGTVQSGDISMLSAKWGKTSTSEGWSNIIDVGPTVDRARRSRPTPDNVINIEDMMIFAMNYYNTNYTQYVRQDEESAPPVTIAMNVVETPAQLRVTLDLAENGEGLTGVSIPVGYGSGLILQSVEQGSVWPESSLLLFTNEEGVVEVSGAVLGTGAAPEANGVIAELVFAIVGTDTSLELRRMTARDFLNREIEITNNPGAYTDNEDLINIIPAESYLAQNFPNPFNPSTTVRFGLKEAGKVQLSVYNNRGQLVRTLVNDHKAAGTYQIVWDGKDRNGRSASSGLYLIRLETPGLVQTCKALMIK